MITKEDWLEWKANKVTKQVMAAIANYIEIGREELTTSAGEAPLTDRERVGKIAAFREVLELTFDELESVDGD